jgi:hypothetical protein
VVQLAQLLVSGGMPEQDAGEYARATVLEYAGTHAGELQRNRVDTTALQ